ncbi:hypothetical protein CLV59_104198 [Chitinophaga dinghuensis]|uniref:Uncharacterized protein n=1 Tax=Chitinophaga dinghuensis TaxID=1539050 RepID=A0A327W017_9BACT|nr:hypothetical protein CLV59_104198 [Chitinophaga dinghuensis]
MYSFSITEIRISVMENEYIKLNNFSFSPIPQPQFFHRPLIALTINILFMK